MHCICRLFLYWDFCWLSCLHLLKSNKKWHTKANTFSFPLPLSLAHSSRLSNWFWMFANPFCIFKDKCCSRVHSTIQEKQKQKERKCMFIFTLYQSVYSMIRWCIQTAQHNKYIIVLYSFQWSWMMYARAFEYTKSTLNMRFKHFTHLELLINKCKYLRWFVDKIPSSHRSIACLTLLFRK